ncbi:hypothetical protein [Methylobrevis pamukkalensis]|uniref:Uncharacterized protein n=1 Tax=Methylobrevis pamukkalensis TaxID=1439726 RepID=A0A1E3H4G0_9HYPH|nr:hypothetical protein [Methylobrevis pamukkalensis]ODN71213.1 hypothetical protein A6302_01502 [Methylobrevis pamukkalensis]
MAHDPTRDDVPHSFYTQVGGDESGRPAVTPYRPQERTTEERRVARLRSTLRQAEMAARIKPRPESHRLVDSTRRRMAAEAWRADRSAVVKDVVAGLAVLLFAIALIGWASIASEAVTLWRVGQ